MTQEAWDRLAFVAVCVWCVAAGVYALLGSLLIVLLVTGQLR